MKKMFVVALLYSMLFSAVNAEEVTIEEKITGLYVAFFNRAADEGGLTYWTNRGNSSSNQSNVLKELAAGFALHPSFERAYGALNNRSFVEEIYKNALGREGDAPGVAYWSGRLDLPEDDPNYLSRSDFVSVFVEAALTFDRNDPQYASLSEEDLNAAQLRHDLLANKAEVGLAFTHQLGTLSNVSEEHQNDPESDPAYLASIMIIAAVTENPSTVTDVLHFLSDAQEGANNPVRIINHTYKRMFITNNADRIIIENTNDPADYGYDVFFQLTYAIRGELAYGESSQIIMSDGEREIYAGKHTEGRGTYGLDCRRIGGYGDHNTWLTNDRVSYACAIGGTRYDINIILEKGKEYQFFVRYFQDGKMTGESDIQAVLAYEDKMIDFDNLHGFLSLDALNGRTFHEVNERQQVKWETEITFDTLIENQKSASIDFRGFDCGGELIYSHQKNEGYFFQEVLTYGNCISGCKMWIKGDGSEYKEFCDNKLTHFGHMSDI